tara:strand:- start:421 stop:879 length:459 start_codon:yes stop_codon:yes gene_type:complete
MYKKVIALVLLAYSVFGFNVDLSNIDITPFIPTPSILNIEKPSDPILSISKNISDLVTDQDDREKLAIFNYEFSKRILGYNTDCQQVNDVYVIAGKLFFKSTLADKYDGLAESITDVLKSVIGDDNHQLSKSERKALHAYFEGVSWALIQKG